MKKLAVFDFCETLVSFQTADAFVDYVRSHSGTPFMKVFETLFQILRKAKLLSIYNKIFPYSSIGKKLKIWQLRGVHYKELDRLSSSFYNEKIKPELIVPVLQEMNRRANLGYELCLASAGYAIYLKYFSEEFQIKHMIATKIAFDSKGNLCRGRILGKDCYHTEKVNRIATYFKDQSVDNDESIVYSDSIADLPMLKMFGKGVIVSRNRKQSWSKKYAFEEIIWDKHE